MKQLSPFQIWWFFFIIGSFDWLIFTITKVRWDNAIVQMLTYLIGLITAILAWKIDT